MEKRIKLDLYKLYVRRMDGINFVSVQHFYFYLRLLLACDVTHDFSKPRGDLGKRLWLGELSNDVARFNDFKNKILTDNANRVIRDCVGLVDTSVPLSYIETVLNQRKPVQEEELDRIKELTKNDDQAKKTTDAIHSILGLTEQNVQQAMLRSNPCADFSILDLIKTLDIVKSSGKSHTASTNYNITIDATSDKTNLTPFFSELMNRAHKKDNRCKESNEINIVNTYATHYDSSNDDALTKLFTSLGLSRRDFNSSNLIFDIKVDQATVFNGSLKKEGGKIKLTIESYFKETFEPALERGSDSTDSVNGITIDMLRSYNASIDSDEIFNLTIHKTMGDFLQIMTHLYLSEKFERDINVFITFDILCAKIAGILDKNVFYEKKFTSDADKISAGLCTFFNETARDERTSALSLIKLPHGDGLTMLQKAAEASEDTVMSDSLPPLSKRLPSNGDSGRGKRSRNSFGKKKPKVKKLPNKALLTKLKSVGIKITKKQGKRRVYLSRPELIKRATAFKNLQLRAKKLKVRIMYKNKKGKYVYKTAKRLMNDIKRQISKLKKSAKKPVKKSNVKQMKQRFG
jgi:hypothetical protein